MVLQFSTSPFASRATSSPSAERLTSAPAPSSTASPSKGSSAASAASSIVRLSFFADRVHHRHKRSEQRQRALSSSAVTPGPDNTPLFRNQKTDGTPVVTITSKRTIIRVISLASAVSTIVLVSFMSTQGVKSGFGAGTQYLTIVGLLMTVVCLTLSLGGDLLNRPHLIQYKNAILPVVVPAECAIACLYWYLTLKDVYNIYPDGVRYLPLWLDLQMHGVPFISAMIEMFFHSESLRICRVTEFVKVLSFGIFYIAWSSICAHMNGEWPYPVFQKIACPWERLRMMVTSTLIGLAMHVVISEYYIWLKSTKVAKKSKDPSVTSSEPCQS